MIKIITSPVSKEGLKELAREFSSDYGKAVVDIERGIMAAGGEFHVDGEAALLENGSKQENLWGINIYPDKSAADRIEFDSMINLRPHQSNRSRGVENQETREKIIAVVNKLIRE